MTPIEFLGISNTYNSLTHSLLAFRADHGLCLGQVNAGNEPDLFTQHFLGWDASLSSRNKFVDPYQAKLEKLKIEAENKVRTAVSVSEGGGGGRRLALVARVVRLVREGGSGWHVGCGSWPHPSLSCTWKACLGWADSRPLCSPPQEPVRTYSLPSTPRTPRSPRGQGGFVPPPPPSPKKPPSPVVAKPAPTQAPVVIPAAAEGDDPTKREAGLSDEVRVRDRSLQARRQRARWGEGRT